MSVGIPTYFLLVQFERNFEERSKIMLNATLDIVRVGLFDVMLMGHSQNIRKVINIISKNKNVDQIRIFSLSGEIKYATNPDEVGFHINDIAPHHGKYQTEYSRRTDIINDRGVYSASEPIYNGKECRSCHGTKRIIAYLDVDTNLTRAEKDFRQGYNYIIFISGIAIIILVAGSFFLFNYFIDKPVINFLKALDAVDDGNLQISLPAKKDDEFGRLEKHFNSMVEHLRESREKIEALHFEQLQRADRLVTLGELAAEMAHEINNPAAIIMSRADYLQMEAADRTELRKFNEDFQAIINQTEKISRITGSILKYSRKLPKNFEKIDLVGILKESLQIMEPRTKKKNISILTEIDEKLPAIRGDATQLEQVFTNLINNALDAMEDSGKLTIIVKCDGDDAVTVRVSDTGCGIEKDKLDNIFTPFYSTKTDKNGTGLGLYIVRNICNNHSATIVCDSVPGKGTNFTIKFNSAG